LRTEDAEDTDNATAVAQGCGADLDGMAAAARGLHYRLVIDEPLPSRHASCVVPSRRVGELRREDFCEFPSGSLRDQRVARAIQPHDRAAAIEDVHRYGHLLERAVNVAAEEIEL